jgi:hypothetical protein
MHKPWIWSGDVVARAGCVAAGAALGVAALALGWCPPGLGAWLGAWIATGVVLLAVLLAGRLRRGEGDAGDDDRAISRVAEEPPP